MITSYHPEAWNLMSRGTDSQGRAMCHVRRISNDPSPRATVWRLVQYPNGWRNVGQFLSGFNGFRATPERNGVKLSCSRTDLTLLSYAETGHGNLNA